MGRRKGSINQKPQRVPETVLLTTEQRIEFLANLIVDRIAQDQAAGRKLLKRIERTYAARTTTA